MTTIPDGIRAESERNPSGFQQTRVPDSALSQPASQGKNLLTLGTTTDRAGQDRRPAAIRLSDIHPLDALAVLVAFLRPDWRAEQVRAVLRDAGRAPADLVPAAIACALDHETRHPGRIASYDVRQPTPVPPSLRCPHGVAAIDEDGRHVGVGCLRCRPPAAPVPRCEHGKPFGIGCCGASA